MVLTAAVGVRLTDSTSESKPSKSSFSQHSSMVIEVLGNSTRCYDDDESGFGK